MEKYIENSILVKINCFESKIVRLGDGLRYALMAYKKLQNSIGYELDIDDDLLYEILTDISTFSNKVSLDHFYNYVTTYLLTESEPDIGAEGFSPSLLSSYTCIDELTLANSKVPIELLNFFYFELWNILVKQALKNIHNKNSSYNLKIPFKKISIFYENMLYDQNYNKDYICTKFLNDLEAFLTYNHIIKLKDFEVDEKTYDLTIPIQFKFAYLEKY